MASDSVCVVMPVLCPRVVRLMWAHAATYKLNVWYYILYDIPGSILQKYVDMRNILETISLEF